MIVLPGNSPDTMRTMMAPVRAFGCKRRRVVFLRRGAGSLWPGQPSPSRRDIANLGNMKLKFAATSSRIPITSPLPPPRKSRHHVTGAAPAASCSHGSADTIALHAARPSRRCPAALVAAVAPSPATLPFQNPDLPAEERITDLISRLTLEEKIDCMPAALPCRASESWGSPHIEGYHGVAQGGPSNWGAKPDGHHAIPPGVRTRRHMGSRTSSARSRHRKRRRRATCSRAKSYRRPASSCVRRTPTSRAIPRWGRTEEVFGEDPFLVGTLATGLYSGLQGDDPRYWKTAALLKHFLANSNEDGRGNSSSNFDERLWREYYAQGVRAGHAG